MTSQAISSRVSVVSSDEVEDVPIKKERYEGPHQRVVCNPDTKVVVSLGPSKKYKRKWSKTHRDLIEKRRASRGPRKSRHKNQDKVPLVLGAQVKDEGPPQEVLDPEEIVELHD